MPTHSQNVVTATPHQDARWRRWRFHGPVSDVSRSQPRVFRHAALGLLLTCLLMLGMGVGHVAVAQPADTAAAIRTLEDEVEAIRAKVDTTSVEERRELIAKARASLGRAEKLQADMAAPVADIEQRIAQLGADAAKSPDAAVRQQHVELSRELALNVALTRRAALSQVDATQMLDKLSQAQVQALGEELFERGPSPLAPFLWQAGFASLLKDLQQFQSRTEPAKPSTDAPTFLGLALLGSLVVVGLLRRRIYIALDNWGARLAHRLSGRDVAFSRALFALGFIGVRAVIPTLAAVVAVVLMHAMGLHDLTIRLSGALLTAVVFGLIFRAMAQAVLQPRRRVWRLWKFGTPAAESGIRAANALAMAIVAVVAVEATVQVMQLSAPTQVLVHSALALACTALLASALYMLDRMWRSEEKPASGTPRGDASRVLFWVGLAWLMVALLAVFGAVGYVNLANRMSQWTIWAAVVVLSTSVLMVFVDGVCSRLATTRNVSAQAAANLPLRQASVLLSAISRLFLVAIACGALLVPFGAGFTSVLGLLSPLAKGFEIGGVTVSAQAALRAVLAFGIVVVLVRLLRSWFAKSYFPTTNLPVDARDSIDKIVRYMGIVLAVLWALTAFGVGMEKVAILASALSVGIGFGLQAITQNFVSGIILLVERPVRIGDWVKVNDVEGDIRRINVRSTEIQVGDHSTMIVPNSELITKVVQNKTMGNSLGRAQILLSVPVETDLDHAISTLAQTLADDQEVLPSPAPAVFVDRVEGSMAVLNCFVHVQSPRSAYGVRSRLILTALRNLRAQGVPVVLPPQQFVISPSSPS